MRISAVLTALASLVGALVLISYLTGSPDVEAVVENPAPAVDDEPEQKGPTRPEVATEAPFPAARVDAAEHDFGTMGVDQTRNHAFKIVNEGEGPLEIAQGPTTCKCTLSQLPSDIVPPGESVDVTLEWTPKSPSTEFGQEAVIYTNDPENEEIRLRVSGTVVPLIESQPHGGWTLGVVNDDEPTQFEGVVYSVSLESFEITDVDASDDYVAFAVKPLSEEELESLEAKSGYRLDGTLNPTMELGAFRSQVVVQTDVPEIPDVRMEISGSRAGPMTVIGKGWHAASLSLDMGRFSADKGKSHPLSVFIRGMEEDFELSEIRSEDDRLSLSLEKDERFQGSDRQRYMLTFHYAPGDPVVHPASEPATITATTNHPAIGDVKFDVSLSAE